MEPSYSFIVSEKIKVDELSKYKVYNSNKQIFYITIKKLHNMAQ
ncbi:N-acetylmuramoyl-L-alanine amidase (plasmid) [Bacillus sp. JAS24-2]|nr:N-acetylmuramoyl-L-alanine amidase [Bacillus sp. JAS24-2]